MTFLFLNDWFSSGRVGTSPVVQWLGLWASAAGSGVWSLVRELRSLKPFGTTKKQTKKQWASKYRKSILFFCNLRSIFYVMTVCVSHSVVSDSLWPHVACQAPLSMEFSSKNTGVGCHSLSRVSSQPRDGTCISCTAGRFFTTETPGKPICVGIYSDKYICMYICIYIFRSFLSVLQPSIIFLRVWEPSPWNVNV